MLPGCEIDRDFTQLADRMKLGISSYTFTWAVGVRDYLPEKTLRWASKSIAFLKDRIK